MNIFKTESQILCGKKHKKQKCNLKDLLNLIKELKEKMGEKSYLLDNYLILIMKSANCFQAQEAAGRGMRTV